MYVVELAPTKSRLGTEILRKKFTARLYSTCLVDMGDEYPCTTAQAFNNNLLSTSA